MSSSKLHFPGMGAEGLFCSGCHHGRGMWPYNREILGTLSLLESDVCVVCNDLLSGRDSKGWYSRTDFANDQHDK